MKRLIALFLCFIFVFTVAGCGVKKQVVTSEIYVDDDSNYDYTSSKDKNISNNKNTSSNKNNFTSTAKPSGLQLTFGGKSADDYCIVCDDITDQILVDASNKLADAIFAVTGKRPTVDGGYTSDYAIIISRNAVNDGLPNRYSVEFDGSDININGDSSTVVATAVDKFIAMFNKTKKNFDIPSNLSITGEVKFSAIEYNNKNLKYIGRWKETDKGDGVVSLWNYSSVEISFTGNIILVEASSAPAADSKNKNGSIFVTIDGGEETEFKPENGYIVLNMASSGKHTVKIAGNVYNAVTLKNFYIPSSEKVTEPTVKKNILFIGDSISHYPNCYSFHVGKKLGWDYSVVAQAGMALQDNHGYYHGSASFCGIAGVGMETNFFKNESAMYNTTLTDYNFKYTTAPDVVVIYLGTNDALDPNNKNDVKQFTDTYSNFISAIRTKFPNCAIYMMESVSKKEDTHSKVTQVVNMAYNTIKTKHSNIKIIKSSVWDIEGQSDGIHPTAAGSQDFATKVAEVIKKDYK